MTRGRGVRRKSSLPFRHASTCNIRCRSVLLQQNLIATWMCSCGMYANEMPQALPVIRMLMRHYVLRPAYRSSYILSSYHRLDSSYHDSYHSSYSLSHNSSYRNSYPSSRSHHMNPHTIHHTTNHTIHHTPHPPRLIDCIMNHKLLRDGGIATEFAATRLYPFLTQRVFLSFPLYHSGIIMR